MHYYIYYANDNFWTIYNNWWDLISYLDFVDEKLNTIGHNLNDLYIYHDWRNHTWKYSRYRIVYDSNFRIININTIKESLKKYKPRYKKNKIDYIFRYDPIPHTSKRRFRRIKIKKNKNYISKLQDFKAESRVRKRIEFVSMWNDELRGYKYDRCWKKKKIKKQWMKNYGNVRYS